MADHIAIVPGAGAENVRTAEQYRSYGQIEIHTPTATYGPGSVLDPTLSLITVSIQKQLSSTNSTDEIGQATILLTSGIFHQDPSATWLDYVQIMDLVVVYLSNQGPSNLRTRFIGYITSIKEVIDTSNAQAPQRYIQILAQDPMMAFQTDLIFNTLITQYTTSSTSQQKSVIQNLFRQMQATIGVLPKNPGSIPLLSLFASVLGFTTYNNRLFTITPSETAHILMNGALTALFNPVSSVRNQYFAGSVGFVKLVTQAFDNTSQFSGAGYYVSAQSGTFYATLTQVMNTPFLEFFGDVRSADQLGSSMLIPPPYTSTNPGVSFGPDRATFNVVIRNTPFDTTSQCPGTSATYWEQLPVTTVYMKHTVQKNLGPDNTDVVNYYFVYPEGYVQQLQGFQNSLSTQYGALIDAPSVARYGLQQLVVPILGYPVSLNPAIVGQFRQTLYDWYKDNPLFYKGTVQIEGDETLRIGTRARLAGTGLTAYIEGIQETYTPFSSYDMTLTLSRGFAYGT